MTDDSTPTPPCAHCQGRTTINKYIPRERTWRNYPCPCCQSPPPTWDELHDCGDDAHFSDYEPGYGRRSGGYIMRTHRL